MSTVKRTLLWEVTAGPDSAPSYVFGTMHVRSEAAFGREATVLDCLEQCRFFAAEYALDQTPGNIELSRQMLMPNGQRLQDLISGKRFLKMKKTIHKSVGLDLSQVQHLRPMLISNMIDEMLMDKERALALDAFLWEQAGILGLERLGLEQIEHQIDILKRIKQEEELGGLLKLCRNISAHRRQVQKMQALYIKGDPKALYQASRRGMGRWRKILLFERNQIMAERFLKISAEGQLFAAIGAAHLWGDQGVLALLKRAGLSLKAR